MTMTTTRMQPQLCPACGYMLDAATLVSSKLTDKTAPVAGDVTICMGCARALLFEDDRRVRMFTKGEMRRMQKHEPRFYDALMLACLMVQLHAVAHPSPPPKPDA